MHRELIRNLQHWQSLYEAMEVTDELLANDGRSYALWDVKRFYEHRTVLPPRQRESIQFCLFENMKESDAAIRMGIKPTNPCAIYATIGLTSLLTCSSRGEIPGYRIEIYEYEGV